MYDLVTIRAHYGILVLEIPESKQTESSMLRIIGRRAHLSPVDTAWLRMEHPTNLMMITGIFMFDEPLDYDALRSTLSKRLLRYDRFRQRAVRPVLPFAPPYWEFDPNFDIDAHLHRIALPAPGNQQALEDLVNDYMSTPLDYSKPLWQFHLVENFGDGCALLCRLHHCIADGIALVRVLLDLTTDEPLREGVVGGPQITGESENGTAQQNDGSRSSKNREVGRAETLIKQGMEFLSDPERMRESAALGIDSAVALGRLLLLSPDPETPFKGKLGVRKRCTWSRPIPLSLVKNVGRITGGTVNDVLISAVTGALGRYLRGRGEAIGGLDFRTVVPVNLRPPDEELKLGNTFGIVFLSLPVGIDDPIERLHELKRRMDLIKGTPEAVVAFGILNAIGITSPEIEDIVVDIFGKKATVVMTNVPGPREVRYLAGKPIRGVMCWVPQSGRLGLGVSIISYAGEVLVGIATDAGLTPDPEKIVEALHIEFDEYADLVEFARESDDSNG
ncbi:MAG: wax ester/triacylglycerol synthase family O-acyltransferase [Candidatus Promineifilaceae bacterium]